jgi:hypothetical protein
MEISARTATAPPAIAPSRRHRAVASLMTKVGMSLQMRQQAVPRDTHRVIRSINRHEQYKTLLHGSDERG